MLISYFTIGTEIGRSLVIRYGKETAMKIPVSVLMTEYERASYERDRAHLKDRDSEYNGEPKHDRSMAEYGKHYGANQYEQHKSYESYCYQVQGGHGHETESSKRHEHEHYQAQPNTEHEGPEEGEANEEGDYQ